ncbi:MAG: hypothetical protein ACXWL5_03325 [Candidatus Chromulinivorax sp.]
MKTQNLKLFVLCVTFFACNKFFAMSSERAELENKFIKAFESQTKMDGKVEVSCYACFDKITKRPTTNGYSEYSPLEIDSEKLKKMSTQELTAILAEHNFNKNYPVVHFAKQCFENCFKSKQS